MTITLPTYNRARGLQRALASARSQTEPDIEILVSDNASQDDTEELVRAAAAEDPRIVYRRHPRNLGLTANFNSMLGAARGRYVMVLADDDWIEDDYVATCRGALDDDPALALACGRAVYTHEDGGESDGKLLTFTSARPQRRVRGYLGAVTDNVAIYGLLRRSMLAPALPMRNCLGGDWLLISRLAFQGAIRTLPETVLHRSAGGTSADFRRTVQRMGLSELEARRPHLAMARFIYEDIAHDSPVYAGLSPARRRVLGAAGALAVLRARPYEVVQDELEPLLARPSLSRLDAPLRRLSQRLRGG